MELILRIVNRISYIIEIYIYINKMLYNRYFLSGL